MKILLIVTEKTPKTTFPHPFSLILIHTKREMFCTEFLAANDTHNYIFIISASKFSFSTIDLFLTRVL